MTILNCVVKSDDAVLDVVFVHGLTGGAEATWRHTNGFDFPSALAREMGAKTRAVNVWSFDYPSPAFAHAVVDNVAKPLESLYVGLRRVFFDPEPGEPEAVEKRATQGSSNSIDLTLGDRGKAFLDLFLAEGIGERPLIFVTHSLGGLIVKALLQQASVSNDGLAKRLLERTAAVFFLATPHSGSALANYFRTASQVLSKGAGPAKALFGGGDPITAGALLLFGKVASYAMKPSDLSTALEMNNQQLLDLDESFRRIVGGRNSSIGVHSFYETRGLLGEIMVVNRWSADPHVGEPPIAVEGEDHSSICKPRDETVPVFRMIAARVHRAVRKALKENGEAPVFAELITDIVEKIRRGSVFGRDLPMLEWAQAPSALKLDVPYFARISDLPVNGQHTANLRRQFAVEFFKQCQAQLGNKAISEEQERAAVGSTYDFDTLVLIAWNRVQLAKALRSMRSLIERESARVRSTYKPTLTVLYQALDGFDSTLDDGLPISFAKDLRRTGRAIENRSHDEGLDQDGITRSRIDDIVARIEAANRLRP
jgi:hypothetical protein